MLDYEYINVLADILLDETCSEKERKLWSETSYRGPLVPAGNKRYQELFQKIMPKEAAFL